MRHLMQAAGCRQSRLYPDKALAAKWFAAPRRVQIATTEMVDRPMSFCRVQASRCDISQRHGIGRQRLSFTGSAYGERHVNVGEVLPPLKNLGKVK